jgi:hypothetical protein
VNSGASLCLSQCVLPKNVWAYARLGASLCLSQYVTCKCMNESVSTQELRSESVSEPMCVSK